jgi:succinate-semialdehyde dehydrogenase/glutarate-semialdehyde dehydrogenase
MTFLTVQNAIEKLNQSYLAWQCYRLSSMESRQLILYHISDELLKNQKTLVDLIHQEMGKSTIEATAEVEKSARACRYIASELPKWLEQETVSIGNSTSKVIKQSLGPVLCIMPWNFPVWQVIRFAAPALAAGNVVCLKHSDLVPILASKLEEIFQNASQNQNLLLNVPVSHEHAAELISDPRIRAVTFTGSARGGRQVALKAAEQLKKVVLELGGSDPYLVFADADLELASEKCAQSRLLNRGQSCISAKRFLVQQGVYDSFLKLFIEELDRQEQDVPLASLQFKNQLQTQVESLVGKGAKLIWQSDRRSHHPAYYPATVLAVDHKVLEKEFYDLELFGPVALVSSFSNEDQSIQMANATAYGLGAAVFSCNVDYAKQIALQLECGMVAINDFVRSDERVPFAGVKNSGFGRELSYFGFLEFVNLKVVQGL